MKTLIIGKDENRTIIGKYIEKNKKIFMLLLGLISLFEALLFVRGTFLFTISSFKHCVYLFSYVFLFVISLSVLIYLLSSEISRNHYSTIYRIISIYAGLIVLWSLIISSLDMLNGNFPIVYLTVIVTMASIVVLNPFFFLAVCLGSLVILIGLDGAAGFNYFISSSEFINIAIFIVMAVMINVRLYIGSVKEYRANEVLVASVLEERNRVSAISIQTIKSIINTVDAKDKYTREHSQRVSDYAVLIAEKLNWPEERINELREIALLHDIGKIGIPDGVLNNTGALSDEEYRLMKQHTVTGGEILQDLTILPHVALGAKYHHERYDGKGYPEGLEGEEIPIEARIIAVADSFDAMSSNRIYRKHLSREKIISELIRGKGTQFDPEIIDVFLPEAENILNNRDLDDSENGEN